MSNRIRESVCVDIYSYWLCTDSLHDISECRLQEFDQGAKLKNFKLQDSTKNYLDFGADNIPFSPSAGTPRRGGAD